MPGAEHGFKSAIADILIGVIISAILGAIGGELGSLALLLFSLLSIVGMIETLDRMEHWSLLYLVGWLAGITLVGSLLLEKWEVQLSIIVGILYVAIKLMRKRE
jgi:hypothetical protein